MQEQNFPKETNQEEISIKAPKKAKTAKFTQIMILITVILVSSTLSIRIYSWLAPKNPSPKLSQIDSLVRKYYSGEIDDTVLDDALATAYMSAINDKYGFYRNAEESVLVENSIEGNASGIGVTVYNDEENKALAVFRVDSGSPAAKSGIKVYDKIIAIDGKTVAEVGFAKSVEAIKREIGKTAEIKLIRDGAEHILTVKYEDFVRQSVYTEVVDGYGYVCITAFNEATVAQFKQAYEALNREKVKGFIFDVRDNGGGTVDSVCEILDILVSECNLITIRYADGSEEISHKSNAEKCSLPMVVLTNEATASAAELFSANLRDMSQALLIGNNTYGKGVVQRTYFLTDGSCVRFTVGEFLPAGGKGFNGKGLAPDFEVSFTDEESKNRYALGKADPYLKKAIEQLNKLTSEEK